MALAREMANGTEAQTTDAKSLALKASTSPALPEETIQNVVRLPRSVQAAYLRPLKRQAKYGLPACDLQLRSYSVRNVEFFADFALRAAYYLNMPASGPVPLPKLIQRWTVPRANFVFKKSQENFERITLRRLVQIQDAHPETVKVWLAFLRKHAYHGIGMKANIWEHETLDVSDRMESDAQDIHDEMDKKWSLFGREQRFDREERVVDELHHDTPRTAVQGTVLPRFSQQT